MLVQSLRKIRSTFLEKFYLEPKMCFQTKTRVKFIMFKYLRRPKRSSARGSQGTHSRYVANLPFKYFETQKYSGERL